MVGRGGNSRLVLLVMVGVLAMTGLTVPAAAVTGPCADPSDAAYDSHDCKVARLRERSFTVIAVVDNGINPYHVDFRLDPSDDMVGVHPSEYIEGYPAAAQQMSLSFDAPTLTAAYQQDAAQWQRATTDELSWVDGTTIIGGHSAVGGHFAQDGSHGTPVASQAAGRVIGPNHPDVLIVAVKAFSDGLEWAAQQPWIDVITNSWGTTASVVDATRTAVAQGKTVCFATGNFTAPVWPAMDGQGPAWHVNVGAEHVGAPPPGAYYSGIPADVLGITSVPAADHTSMTGSRTFAGTSGGTPAVCGLIARTISQARARMGDTSNGPADGVVAQGTAGGGPSADGRLTRAEIDDAVMATARPSTYLPAASYTRGGYGVVSGESVKDAIKVLFGEMPRPSRPDEDRWIQTIDAARNAVYGPPPS